MNKTRTHTFIKHCTGGPTCYNMTRKRNERHTDWKKRSRTIYRQFGYIERKKGIYKIEKMRTG